MKPFVRVTALALALLFLAVALFAWAEVLSRGNLFSDPLVKAAAGWLITGLMFLALGLRGRRPRFRKNAESSKNTKFGPSV